MMKGKGFSLIELLVVVAIIGILAAVGIVAYSGYTASARITIAKGNQAAVSKYIGNEFMRCEIGEETIFNNTVNCNNITAQGVAQFVTAAMTTFGFENPYGASDGVNTNAIKSGGAAFEDQELGYTIINTQGSNNFTIDTCFVLPCGARTAGVLTNVVSVSVPLN